MMCGCPVLTTDWGAFTETILPNVTGYRCRTFDQFLWAAKNADKIDPKACRDWAIKNYSMDRIKWMYQEFFEQIYDLRQKGWYEIHPERKQLDWMQRHYPQ